MNILVTGVTGFIGMNLLKALNDKYVVYVLVRPTTDLSKVSTEHIFVFDDNIVELSNYLRTNKIRGIVHLASLYITQHQPMQIKDLILSNVYLGAALLEAAVEANVKWFLNTGTIWQNYIPDSQEYCPVNLYAATKQAFIDMAKYYTEISELKFCTLKLCDTYGPDDTRPKILTLFKRIAETGETLDMSPGEQLIDLVYIDDVVDGFEHLILMLENDACIKNDYVLSSGHPIRLKDLASMYEEITGKVLNINWGGRRYKQREVMIPWQEGNVLFKIDRDMRKVLININGGGVKPKNNILSINIAA
jgi:nucleoside-diphosphate-sugar epimerase